MPSHLIPNTCRGVTALVACMIAVAAVQTASQAPSQNASAPAPVILTPGPAAARTPATAEEFDAYFKKISNWGRWGASDELAR